MIRRALTCFDARFSGAGEELEVDESSAASKMKALLKRWGLPQSGKKDELWARLQDQVCERRSGPVSSLHLAFRSIESLALRTRVSASVLRCC